MQFLLQVTGREHSPHRAGRNFEPEGPNSTLQREISSLTITYITVLLALGLGSANFYSSGIAMLDLAIYLLCMFLSTRSYVKSLDGGSRTASESSFDEQEMIPRSESNTPPPEPSVQRLYKRNNRLNGLLSSLTILSFVFSNPLKDLELWWLVVLVVSVLAYAATVLPIAAERKTFEKLALEVKNI